MRRATRFLSLLILASIVLPVGAAAAGQQTSETVTVSSIQQADDRDHPASHLLPVIVPRPFHGGARVCGYYENDAYSEPEDGRVKLEVSLWRDGARIGRFGFGRRAVRFNQLDLGCRNVPRLRKGDTLLFDFRFSEMPRLAPRIFSHGGLVNTYMFVRASIEPPAPKEPSTIEFLGIEPPFGSRVPAGGKIRVRIGYTCGQSMGCNVGAGFSDAGDLQVVRGVAPGTRRRTMVLRCREGSGNSVLRGLTIAIERARRQALDAATVVGAITCVGSGH